MEGYWRHYVIPTLDEGTLIQRSGCSFIAGTPRRVILISSLGISIKVDVTCNLLLS